MRDESSRPVWLWDPARLRIAWANSAACALWQAADSGALSDRPFGAGDPFVQGLQHLALRLGEEGAAAGTLPVPVRDAPLELIVAPAVLSDGRPGLRCIAFGDLTHASDPLAEAARAAPLALAVFDGEGSLISENAAAARLFAGAPLAMRLGAERSVAEIAQVTARGQTAHHMLRLQTIAGPLPGRITAFASTVRPDHLIVTFEDLSARGSAGPTRAEKPADAGKTAPLLELADALPAGLAVVGPTGRILWCNRAAAQMLAADGDEQTAGDLLKYVMPEGRGLISDALSGSGGAARILSEGTELDLIGGDGGRRAITLYFVPLSTAERRHGALMLPREPGSSAHGAPRPSRIEATHIANVSHELRTPLTAIIGFAEIMAEERFGPLENPRYRDYAQDIHRSGTFLLSLVNDLLDYARVEAGHAPPEPERLKVSAVVEACAALVQGTAERFHILLQRTVPENIPDLFVDKRSLQQILLNLLSNAVKFTEPGGHVLVTARNQPDGGVEIRVRDTGIGMTADEIRAAFEPFRRVAGRLKREGSGLGLPLARALANANGFDLTLLSTPGSGTTARLVIPAANTLAPAAPSPAGST